MVSQKLIDATNRHQIMLEGYKKAQSSELSSQLVDAIYAAFNSVFDSEVSTKKELNKKLAEYSRLLEEIFIEFNLNLSTNYDDFVVNESEFQAELLSTVGLVEDAVPLDYEKLDSAIRNTVITVSGLYLAQHLTDYKNKQKKRLTGTVRSMSGAGLTMTEIKEEIFGKDGDRYLGNTITKVKNGTESEVNTLLQHYSAVSSVETASANIDKYRYVWISILDSKTSPTCQGLSNQIFEKGHGPLPPAHYNCRSYIIPYTEDFEDVNESYYEWMLKQPQSVQNEAIGKTRAELLRSNKLTPDEFTRLNLNRSFQQRTLEEMKELNPIVFEDIAA